MHVSANVKRVLVGMVLAVLAMVTPSIAQGVPDVVGIRPGMSAQDAYNALKARANGAKIGMGQMTMPGVTDKPVVMVMSVRVLGSSPGETIAVWLTLPPNTQQVWGVIRQLQFDAGKEMLKSVLLDGLKQKYGAETDPNYWAFDEQGGRVATAGLRGNNCANREQANLGVPDDTTAPMGVSPLIYTPGPEQPCSSVMSVRAEYGNASSGGSEMVRWVTVTLQDPPLARRSQQAYQSALANGDAAKRKEEIERAKQQKAPPF